jgi:NMT1-like family
VLEFDHWHLLKGLAAILCIVGMSWLALDYFVPAPPSKFTIATGLKNQTYEAIGKRYREILARSHVDVELRLTNGAVDNIKLLNDPTSGIKVGIAQGGISNSDQSPDLLSLGRINYQIYWIFHRATEALDDLRQLQGKRIAIGPQGSGQRATTEKILGISGVNPENSTLLNLTTQGAENALNEGQIDALFLPIALDAPILQSLLKNPRLRPMSFTDAEAVTRIFPFLVRLVLPRAVIDFERIIPATDMILIATPNVVLVRKDIHPALIDLLAQTIVEAHGKPGVFQQAGEFPTLIDPEYPVAQSARDFYKNGPSFMNRYLPFWMTNYVQRIIAVLVAVIAIVLPMFNFAPKLYHWFLQDRMRKLYRRLRIVEDASQTELTAPQVVSLQTELENIDSAARILPQRHSDLFFILEQHIILTRTQLASRLVEVRRQITKVV